MTDRVRILCEDRLTERFLRRLCDRFRLRTIKGGITVAPQGKGSAAGFVEARYAGAVKLLRSCRYQRNLGLLVAIDGDSRGCSARKAALEGRLADAGLDGRRGGEPVVLLVPTWSIETWIAHLCGRSGVVESRPLKRDGEYRELWDTDRAKTASVARAVTAWGSPETAGLPSLTDAESEGRRAGLG